MTWGTITSLGIVAFAAAIVVDDVRRTRAARRRAAERERQARAERLRLLERAEAHERILRRAFGEHPEWTDPRVAEIAEAEWDCRLQQYGGR